MGECIPTAYDTVVYPGYAYIQTHPDHMAALARLCGIHPAPLEECRVLEVGCGDAANLIPMALGLPRASFRGFDLAASSIERGRTMAREIGIANLELERLDICDAPDRLGEFDYIIAHGFYSWVPKAARDKLMAICRASLAPEGVAFVSYNTLPGGHIRRMIREMMLFHIDRAGDAQTKITQSRALLGFLCGVAAGADEYEALLKKELERVRGYSPGFLYHDDLAPINDSVYLYEFVNHAAEFDLQFLADLNSSLVNVEASGPESAKALADLESDPVLREQYLDFAVCRRFRQTLLCHAGLPVSHQLDDRRLEGMLVSSAATPVSEVVDVNSDREEEFRGQRNASLRTSHPTVKALMAALCSVWPERLSLEELRAAVAARLGSDEDSISHQLLSRGVLAAFSLRVLGLHVYAPRVTKQPGDYPQTSRLVRLQAERGMMVTNLLHQTVKAEGDALRMLTLLDGQRSRAGLAEELHLSPAEVEATLAQIARLALLEA